MKYFIRTQVPFALSFALALLLSTYLYAQDKIILRADKTEWECKVVEVGVKEIKYQLNATNTTLFSVLRRDVAEIVFASGERVVLENNAVAQNADPTLGRNILSVIPQEFAIVSYNGQMNAGFAYERILGKRQTIGLLLPVTFKILGDDYKSFVSVSPGVKFYLNGVNKADYAFGASLLFNRLERTTLDYGPPGPFMATVNSRYTVHNTYGLMFNNYINMRPSRKFQITLQLGTGFGKISGHGTDHVDTSPYFTFQIGSFVSWRP